MKKYGIITFLIFLISLIYSFSTPPEGSLKSKKDKNEKFEYQTEIEMMYEAARKNYNSFDNFLAQYKNTVLGWFGKSRNLDESYITEKLLKERGDRKSFLIRFGTILPYIFIISSAVLFFKENKNLKVENE